MNSTFSVRRLESGSGREKGIGALRRYACLGRATDGYGTQLGTAGMARFQQCAV
jgi:hypothetical protein